MKLPAFRLSLLFLVFALPAAAQNPAADRARIRSIEEKWENARRGLDWSTEAARQVSSAKMLEAGKDRIAAIHAEAKRRKLPVSIQVRSGEPAMLVRLDEDGHPRYEGPDNDNARITTAVHLFQGTGSNGPGGSGFRIGIWDSGAVRDEHDEFMNTGSSRIDLGGDTLFMSNHATHIGGTLAAFGTRAGTRGMAPLARLLSYDSGNDVAEAGTHGATGALDDVSDKICVSNHSYSIWGGWRSIETPPNSGTSVNTWLGKKTETEDSTLGQYGNEAGAWDEYCVTHEYHLPFRSAGNNRSKPAPAQGETFRWADGTTTTYDAAIHAPSNDSRGGWDLLGSQATGKNVMTVGAVTPAVAAGARSLAAAVSANFSAWGPTDDGRIKPDIVADGVGLFSSVATGNSNYDWSSGTSMSTPNACGSAVLLQERYRTLYGGIMRASTLKALIIHTADDIGNPGPDYQFGWGLMNANTARDLITLDSETSVPVIVEQTLEQGGDYTFPIFYGAGPVKVTLCWTDPAAAASSALDDSTRKLVNDLDLTLEYVNGATTTINRPWVLNPANPGNNASTGINNRDNVEQVVWSTNPGLRWIHVRHQGTLTGGSQKFSLIISGHNTSTDPPSMHITGPWIGAEGVTSSSGGPRSFGITNNGGGSLNWSAVSETSWISVSPGSGSSTGEKDTVNLTFNTASLPAGNHTGTVRVSAPGQPDKYVLVFFTQRLSVSLAEALDTPGRTWTANPANSWLGWQGESWDGEDSAVLNSAADGGVRELTTTVTGPAYIRWRWRLDDPAEQRQGNFYVNSEYVRVLAANSGWATDSHTLAAGVWTLRFLLGGSPAGADWEMLIDKVEVLYPPVIAAQSFTGFVGQATSYTGVATNQPTTWGLSSAIPGLTLNTSTGVISGTPTTAGTYSRTLTAYNPAGSASATLTVTVHASTTLQAALDNSDLVFQTNSDVPWFGQSVTTHDGTDAARSGAITHSGQSNMAWNVTGPAVLRYWWKVSSEASWDRLRIFLDGTENANIHGEIDWAQRTLTIPSGTHTVNFRYTKDGSNSVGQDAGFVDQVEVIRPPVLGPWRGQVAAMIYGVTGVPYSYSVPFSGGATTTFSATGLPVPLSINPTTGVISGTPAGPGSYTVNVQATNIAGTDTQALAFSVAAPIPLDQAVETESILTWNAGGTYSMVGVPGDDFYGRDAARSGPITHSQQSWMQTNVFGPALITYIWQCESEPDFDKLRCLLDGVEQAAISGLAPAETRTLLVPAGSHFVRFSYEKDGSANYHLDTGWVERVSILYPPAFTSSSAVTGWAGQDILHTIAANNADSVTCGPLPAGLVFNAAARTITGSTTSTGTFSPVITATNGAGSTTQTLSITISPTIAIPTAIDYPLISAWTTGSAPWFGQAAVTQDGVDAARAGILAPGEYQTWMSATVSGPARLTWKWRVKSTADRDYLIARLDGLEYALLSGDSGWVDGVMILPAGSHSVRFELLKSGDDFVTGEGAWLDRFNVQIPPAVIVFSAPSGEVGSAFAYTIGTVQGSPSSFAASGLPPGLTLNSTTGAITGTPTHPGAYPVTFTASNAAGSGSTSTTITIAAPVTLPVALDSTLTWTTSGPAWFGQGMFSRDGVDAARCGIVREPLEDSAPEQSALQTTVTGPGYFSCYVRTDSELNYDLLRITLDGAVRHTLSGQNTTWTRIVIPVTAGAHTIRFAYTKDTSVSVGQDTAWVDQVNWSPTGITSVTLSGSNFSITYGTAPGVSFQVQHSTDLVSWANLGTATPGTGSSATLTVSLGAAPRRFWRVVQTVIP